MKRALLLLIPLVAFAGSYDRKEWRHWADLDGDCQNTRAEILIAKNAGPLTLQGCRVVLGRWLAPYTGDVFVNAGRLDIDHIVPLKEAHISGGEHWSRAKKRAFANDPENLLPVSASANLSKGGKDPAKWMPPLATYHCEYAARWWLVKAKHRLTMDSAERAKLLAILRDC